MSDREGAGGRPRWTPPQPETPSSGTLKGSGAVQLGALTGRATPADVRPSPTPPEPAPERPPEPPQPAPSPAARETVFPAGPSFTSEVEPASPHLLGAEPVPASAFSPAAVAEPGRSQVSLDSSRAWPTEPASTSPPVQPADGGGVEIGAAPGPSAFVSPPVASTAPEPARVGSPSGREGLGSSRAPRGGEPFDDRADVRTAPEHPYAESPLAGVDPRKAPRERRSNRGLLIGGGVAAAAVAALAAVALMEGNRGGGEDAPAPRAAGPSTETAEPATPARSFTPPDREAVRDAYAEVGRVYRTAGVSGLADVGRRCFTDLAERPSYRGLDYCSALDAFGAAFAHRVSGSPAPADSWFGQTESRFLRTATTVLGPEGDPAARLVDIRRLAIEVAREGGPAFAAAAPAAATPSAPGSSVQVQTPEPAPRRPSEPSSRLAQGPAPRPEPAPSSPPARPEPPPAPVPVDRETYAGGREPDFGPTAAEVAAARPREGRGPSFNCRSARSESERLVCAEPELARLDRRLNAAYEDAIAAGMDRRSLRREQDRWLSVREQAAPDPRAVADTYRQRIRELDAMR